MVNAFVTEINPYLCSQSHSNLMLPRMALETAEVLCASRWNQIIGWDENSKEYENNTNITPPYYRSLSQRRHPLVLWSNKERINFHWLYHYGTGLIREYRKQYPEKPPLKCEQVYRWFKQHDEPSLWEDPTIFEYRDMTWNVAINDDYRKIMNKVFKKQKIDPLTGKNSLDFNDILTVYRLYFLYKYMYVYTRNHSWGSRIPPDWMTFGKLRDAVERVYGPPTTKTGQNALVYEPPF